MKIAIFSDNFYPELSGITDSVVSLSKELVRLGHEICFFAPEYSARNYRLVGLPYEELNLGKKVNIVRLSSLPAPFAGVQSRMVLPMFTRGLFKKFKPDIIHSQLFLGIGLEALAAARYNKLPLIGTNHTSITDFVHVEFMKKPSLKYAVWYYNCCDLVTAPSQSVFDEMITHGFKKPHQVLSNPLDLEIFYPRREKIKYKKQFGLSGPAIVCAGRLSPEKNIEVVIKAIALAKLKVKDIELAIAGSGKQENELKRLVKKLELKSRVKFLGSLSHDRLAELYNAADVYAIASTSETQSLTLMQALACGLPAVAVNARALPEYVNQKNGFVVAPGDEKALAEKFVLLLKNKPLRDNLSQGAAFSARQYSAPEIAKKWEALYSKVIKGYKSRA